MCGRYIEIPQLDEHPHEGPHCVEDTLRFLNLDKHPHEGPHCVEEEHPEMKDRIV